MSFSDNVPKLQPFKRSVSIIGVGATPFVRVMDDPECDGLTEGELFGYAARAAMKDAGITGKDVDFFVHGQAGPGWISNFGTANIHVANWLGMKGKASMHRTDNQRVKDSEFFNAFHQKFHIAIFLNSKWMIFESC